MKCNKILIVDDVIDNLDTIVKFIEEGDEPYVLFQALNGEVAFEIAVTEVPDLIITDWEMWGIDGIELIKKIKEDKRTSEIPIIMCTGAMLTSENLKTALQAGAVDYIRKPIDKIELLARIQASLRLAESYAEIKKLNDAKDRIFSIIAHDLRGPVGNIRSFSELILYEMTDSNLKKIKEMVSIIGTQSASAFNILDNLFAWASSQQKQLIYRPEKQVLTNAFDSNIELLTGNAVQKKINIKNNIDQSIEAYFDDTLTSIVVRNLMANAIKFTDKGGEILLSAIEENNFIKVSVADTGVGISTERLKTILDKSNYDTTFGTNAEHGSGLGLILCKELVEMSSGEIWVESVVGKGTTFTFSLPKSNEKKIR